MNKYKIVASDLDGTLFNSASRVSEENAAAIKSLDEKGIYFVPSTGRTFGDISHELRDNENIRYFICSNGALVYDKKTKKSIENGLNAEIIKKTLDILYQFDVHVAIRTGGVTVSDADKCTEADFDFYKICDAHIDVLCRFADKKKNFKEWVYTVEKAEALGTFFHSLDELLECKRRLEELDELFVVRQYEYNLDICSAATSKGDALMALADMLEVDRAATIAVGDSDNDIAMVKAAGLGLAVSNACDALKEIADEVICSNEEHSIDYINKHYCK